MGKETVKKISIWARNIWNNFKLTASDWFAILRYQNNVCAACGGVNLSGNRLSTDHCHKTGLIRGLLCHRCNRLLGKIENPRWQATPKLLRALADYWENPTATRALGHEHYGYKGNVGTKAHRKMLKKLAKAEAKLKRRH